MVKTIITSLSGVEEGDVVCSVWSSANKKWFRVMKDNDGNDISVYKLEVERSLVGEETRWILCLYQACSKNTNEKHVFHLNLDKCKVRVWKKMDRFKLPLLIRKRRHLFVSV